MSHWLYFMFGPMIIPMIWMINCNFVIVRNFRFFNTKCNMWLVVQTMIGMMSTMGNFMIIYGYFSETLDMWDYVDYFALILARSCTIAAKYGFFHAHHQ